MGFKKVEALSIQTHYKILHIKYSFIFVNTMKKKIIMMIIIIKMMNV